MFDVTREFLDEHVHQYRITCARKPVSYADVLDLWQDNNTFRSLLNTLLVDSPFKAYRWETPPVTHATAGLVFEFVLIDSPWLQCGPDARTFSAYFSKGESNAGVVSFASLGRDALLVAPSPRAPLSVYTHLGAFMRGAADDQKHALWRVVGKTAQAQIGESPLWISTHGGGVAWLHVRLDSRPKYYGHVPYKSFPRR